MRELNEFLKFQPFKMETMKDLIDRLKPVDYMVKAYLKDAYFSVTMSKESTEFMSFK